MRLFPLCRSGKEHFPTVKQVRKYRDDKETLKCKCKYKGIDISDPALWLKDGEIPPTVGDICMWCNHKYRYGKEWHYICPVCKI